MIWLPTIYIILGLLRWLSGNRPRRTMQLWFGHDPALHVSAPLSSALLSTALSALCD